MKEPISSYKSYCRVWAEVYKKHTKHSERTVYSCYVRGCILAALNKGDLRKPSRKITTDADIIGIYIVRALVAQGMSESDILEHTKRMQGYVDAAEQENDCVGLMNRGLLDRGVEPSEEAPFIINARNRIRYLWALHGGFELKPADDD